MGTFGSTFGDSLVSIEASLNPLPENYIAKAVYFAGDELGYETGPYLEQLNTLIPNNSKYTASAWVYLPELSLQGQTWDFIFSWYTETLRGCDHLDIAAVWNKDLSCQVQGVNDEWYKKSTEEDAVSTNKWHHIFTSMDTGHEYGSKIANIYIDGVNVVSELLTSESGNSFQSTWENICIPAGNAIGRGYQPFHISDLQVWVGQCINLNDIGNLSKFIDSLGLPVSPDVAKLAFGEQTYLFSGDKNTFHINLGNGGQPVLHGVIDDSLNLPVSINP